MRFRAFVLGILLAGPAGSCFAQFTSMGSNGPGYPGYSGPNSQMGAMGQMGQGGLNASMRHVNSITGSVRTLDNRPVNNVRVELRDCNTGAMVSSSYTGMGGSFEFRQLSQGRYELVASSGTLQAEQTVQVDSANTTVDLRLPANNTPNDGVNGRTVSVNQYRIPAAAREEFRKAQDAAAKDKTEDAMKHLDRALELQPAYADALSLRAAYKLDSRDVEGAVLDAQQAIQSDGNYALAYTVMGSALNVQMKFDEALRSLQRAESLAPDVWQTYFEMGRAYAGKSDYTNALQSLDRAGKLAPVNYPLIPLIKAHCLMAVGRNSDAASELQAYLSKNPNGNRTEQARKMLAQAEAAAENTGNPAN